DRTGTQRQEAVMTSTISEMALALGDRVELAILGKATILLALGLILAGSARRARASLRHLLLAATFAALLALPFVALSAPGVTFEIPVSRAVVAVGGLTASAAAPAAPSPAAFVSDPGTPTAAPAAPVPAAFVFDGRWPAPSWSTLARAGWAVGA